MREATFFFHSFDMFVWDKFDKIEFLVNFAKTESCRGQDVILPSSYYILSIIVKDSSQLKLIFLKTPPINICQYL